MFIADEVQTGFGRTGGKWWGCEHYGVEPEIMTMAKGIANGMPLPATICTPAIADSLQKLTISTFGGNPVSAAAAGAVLQFIADRDLLANTAEMGAVLRERLQELKDKYPLVGDVRGMGLLQAIELVRNRRTKEPATEETSALLEAARRNRLLLGKGGLFGNVIRISPPMNIGRSDIDEFARRLDASFASAA